MRCSVRFSRVENRLSLFLAMFSGELLLVAAAICSHQRLEIGAPLLVLHLLLLGFLYR